MSTATKLLRRALNSLNNLEDQLKDLGYGWLGGPQLKEEIETFLAAEPETEEPVGQRKAFICTNCDCIYEAPVSECDCASGANQFTEAFIVTKPEPARKPMTEEEIDVGFNPYRMRWLADDQYFVAGVRYAEKHHFGIGANKSDPDSIDLQSRCRGDKI